MDPDDALNSALPFTAADLTEAARWHGRFRARAICLRLEHDHAAYPDAVGISEPWPSPKYQGCRWYVVRDQRGIWVEDHTTGDGEEASTMDDALRLIAGLIESERFEAIEEIPQLTLTTWAPS